MDIGALIGQVGYFFYDNLYLSIFLCFALGVVTYLKPKAMLKLITIGLVLAGVIYLFLTFTGVTSTGKHQKKELIHKSDQ